MATISTRVEEPTKVAAELIASSIGISLSSAINIFLKRFVVENGFPFDVKVKTNYTELSTDEITKTVQRMVTEDQASHKMPPVAYIDPKTYSITLG